MGGLVKDLWATQKGISPDKASNSFSKRRLEVEQEIFLTVWWWILVLNSRHILNRCSSHYSNVILQEPWYVQALLDNCCHCCLGLTHSSLYLQIYHVTVMPCFDKKLEASRDDFYNEVFSTREVDCVITSGKANVRKTGYQGSCFLFTGIKTISEKSWMSD